uniref:Uncharacterized protein n=1 Tax=Arion vulgaris TaxID=1028688 RepID=A0A0B6ZTE5_9EUPU
MNTLSLSSGQTVQRLVIESSDHVSSLYPALKHPQSTLLLSAASREMSICP